MRPVRTLVALAPLLFVGGAFKAADRAVVAEDITIAATPVTIQPNDPDRTRVGALDLVAGWKLTSRSWQFGGWSSLFVDGDRVTSVNDGGALLRFRLGRFGHPVDATIVPLPPGCGQQLDKTTRDSESLARGAGNQWYVGYEWRNAICRISPDFTRATALAAPPAMRDWPRTKGPEAMLRLADGRFLVFAENAPDGGDVRPLLVFGGDPTDPDARPAQIGYLSPAGYSPTDAVQLPDGRIFVLNRRFSIPELFSAVIVSVDPARIKSGATVTGTPIARFTPPVLSDNYEGLAVTVERGARSERGAWGERTYLWMISDDNQLGWESTYLLKFAVDPRPRPSAKPPAR